MAVVTFPIATGDDDGTGYREAATWAGIPTGTFGADPGTTDLWVSKQTASGTKFCDNTYLRFDTSSIPDGATIVSATLQIYVLTANSADGYSVVGDSYDFGGDPAVVGDWVQSGSPAILSRTANGLTDAALNDFPLSDLSAINKSGYTGIRLTLSAGDPTDLQTNLVQIGSFEHGSVQEPRLEVTYDWLALGWIRA